DVTPESPPDCDEVDQGQARRHVRQNTLVVWQSRRREDRHKLRVVIAKREALQSENRHCHRYAACELCYSDIPHFSVFSCRFISEQSYELCDLLRNIFVQQTGVGIRGENNGQKYSYHDNESANQLLYHRCCRALVSSVR